MVEQLRLLGQILALGRANLIDQLHDSLGAAKRALVAPARVAIVVHHLDATVRFFTPERLALDADPALAVWAQADGVPDHVEAGDALAVGELRVQPDGARHDARRNVGARLRLPVAHVVGAADDGAAAGRAVHHVQHLAAAVVDARSDEHVRPVVAHEHNLPARWRHGRVLDAAEPQRAQAGRVDEDVGGPAGVGEAPRLGEVRQHGALEDDAVADALPDQPEEVHGRVEAHAGKGAAAVLAGRQLARLELPVVGHHVAVPRVQVKQRIHGHGAPVRLQVLVLAEHASVCRRDETENPRC